MRALVALLLAALAGCGKAPAPAAAPSAAAPGETRRPLTGEIVRADAARGVLLVTHDAIAGYMPAMTMEFTVAAADLAAARSGQRIRAELVERGGEYFLEHLWPDDAATSAALAAGARALAEDTTIRGRSAYREVGEAAPDFTLLDQEGRVVSLHRFRGKRVVLNFIFTRCPIATMCPAATQRMSELQAAARQAGATQVEFVSISLDPAYDTPAILQEYARVRGLDLANWSFLTGPDAAVRHLLAQLGVLREFEGATIKHSLATLLIDPSGRIIHRVDGSRWDLEEFLPRLRQP